MLDGEGEGEGEGHLVLADAQRNAVSYLFRKNASKKDPTYYEGVQVLLSTIRAFEGAVRCARWHSTAASTHSTVRRGSIDEWWSKEEEEEEEEEEE